MERLVDLDVLATRLRPVVDGWSSRAEVGPFTWRDARASWPQPIVTDRLRVEVPESLGFTLRRDPDDEFEIVIWTGGWADVGYLLAGDVTSFCPEFKDAEDAYAAVVESVERFLA
ncbi:hypothetical protein [Jiangella gansuensis]|uniref:hypothetical protein n=1 Tax=Jiangella gansuensis TaxID=281473 RepID=UPI000688427F|nr:hypothetical protein [Jiangella gansuensis]